MVKHTTCLLAPVGTGRLLLAEQQVELPPLEDAVHGFKKSCIWIIWNISLIYEILWDYLFYTIYFLRKKKLK